MKILKNLKSEKGSITLFVLVAVLFFSAVLFNVYSTNMNRLQTQNRDISRIQQTYNVDANEIYEETLELMSEEENLKNGM